MNISDKVTGRRVVFITHWFPGHPNHGDHLLYQASLALLRASGAAEIREIHGNTPWPPNLTGLDDAVLVISGGGNLGGRLYPADGLFGVRIAALLPWAEARELGDGWVFMPWFGTLLLQPEGWIYHLQHGWLRLSSATAAGLVFWDAAMGTFWWTSPAQYPHLYRFTDKSWLWYTPDSRAPRWFRNLQRQDWERH